MFFANNDKIAIHHYFYPLHRHGNTHSRTGVTGRRSRGIYPHCASPINRVATTSRSLGPVGISVTDSNATTANRVVSMRCDRSPEGSEIPESAAWHGPRARYDPANFTVTNRIG